MDYLKWLSNSDKLRILATFRITKGKEDISNPPTIDNSIDQFIDRVNVDVKSNSKNVVIRYTLDGSIPTIKPPVVKGSIQLTDCALISARCFRNGKPVSGIAQATFTKVWPVASEKIENLSNGIKYSYYEGDWDKLPNFSALTPKKQGIFTNFDFSPRVEVEHFGFEYTGYIKIPNRL